MHVGHLNPPPPALPLLVAPQRMLWAEAEVRVLGLGREGGVRRTTCGLYASTTSQ